MAQKCEFLRGGRLFGWKGLLCLGLAIILLVVLGVNLWAWHHCRQADNFVSTREYSRAYSHYLQASQIWRWNADLQFRAGQTARRAGLLTEAATHLAECERLQGGSSVPLALEYLLLKAQTGNMTEVEETLWKYVEKNKPETPLILEALARGYIRMLRLGSALTCLDQLLQRDPENIDGLMMRGSIKEGSADQLDSIRDYRRALELKPDRDDARLSLARVLVRVEPEKARELFEQLLQRQPDNPDALLGLAQVQNALGDSEQAKANLRAFLAKNPNNARALLELASLTAGIDEQESLIRQAIVADPGYREAYYKLYLCLSQQKGKQQEAAEAERQMQRLEADQRRIADIVSKEMSKHPYDPNLHFELGSFYLRNGKPETGVRWIMSALKLDPSHQPSHETLYRYYSSIGEHELAEDHRKLLQSNSEKPTSTKP
jgi:tetratricopeptide (TPR) repeat protein